MLPQRALGSQPWTPDAHSFSSGDTHKHTRTSRQDADLFHSKGRRRRFVYPRSVCRCRGNPPHKRTCSRRVCSRTRCGRRTLQDSPRIRPHLGQRRGHRRTSYAQLFFSLTFMWRKKQPFHMDHVEFDRKTSCLCKLPKHSFTQLSGSYDEKIFEKLLLHH